MKYDLLCYWVTWSISRLVWYAPCPYGLPKEGSDFFFSEKLPVSEGDRAGRWAKGHNSTRSLQCFFIRLLLLIGFCGQIRGELKRSLSTETLTNPDTVTRHQCEDLQVRRLKIQKLSIDSGNVVSFLEQYLLSYPQMFAIFIIWIHQHAPVIPETCGLFLNAMLQTLNILWLHIVSLWFFRVINQSIKMCVIK